MTTRSAEKSVELFEARLEKNPGSRVFSRLADAYREEGNLSKAIDICLNGLRNHPDYVTGRLILGRCYIDQENFDKAIEELKKICSVDRQNRVAIKLLAEIYSQKGQDRKADELYSILYKIDPLGSATLRPGMQLPDDKDLFEILEIDENETLPPEFNNSDNKQNDQSQLATTVQPAVDQYETGFLSDDGLSAEKQMDELYPDRTEEIPGNDISSRMDKLFENESLPDDMTQPESDEIGGFQSDFESEELQGGDVSGADVSSRIDELFSGSDEQIEKLDDPDVMDSAFPQNQKNQTKNPDLDQSFVNGVTEYVDENGGAFPEQNDISDNENQLTADAASEFEETLQFDRSMIDKIRSGQDPDQSPDMPVVDFEDLNFSNEINSQGTGDIIDYEEYSAVGFGESDSGGNGFEEESVSEDSSIPENVTDRNESIKPNANETDQNSNFDNLVIEENESDQPEMDSTVQESSDEHVSGDDIAGHLDALFADNDSDENVDMSGSDLIIENQVEQNKDILADDASVEDNDKIPIEEQEQSQELITEYPNGQDLSGEELDLESAVIKDNSDEMTESSLSDFISEITDEIGSEPEDTSLSDEDMNSLEAALVEPQQNDSGTIVDNADLNPDILSESSFGEENSDNDIDQQIDSLFSDNSSDGEILESDKPEPDFLVEESSLDDNENSDYSEGNSYESDNHLLEQISGNDVAQQLDSIFSNGPESSENGDSFDENWAQANSEKSSQESESDIIDTISFDDSEQKTDSKDVEPEIGVNVYGEDTDSIDGPPTISGVDITKRLEEFFPDDNLFDIAGNVLIPDDEEPAENYDINEFYSITGNNAGESYGEDLKGLDHVEIEGAFQEESAGDELVKMNSPGIEDEITDEDKSEEMEPLPGVISEIFDQSDTEENPEESSGDQKLVDIGFTKDSVDSVAVTDPEITEKYYDNQTADPKLPKTENVESDETDKNQNPDSSNITTDNNKQESGFLYEKETSKKVTEENSQGASEHNYQIKKEDVEPVRDGVKSSDSDGINIPDSEKETGDTVFVEDSESEEVMQTVSDLQSEEMDERDRSFSIPDHVLTPTLADIYFHQGQSELAIQLYQRLIERDPDNEKLKKRLEHIKNISEASITETVFYPESGKGKPGNDSPKKERRKKPANDTRPLAGVRIKKSKKAVIAKRKKKR